MAMSTNFEHEINKLKSELTGDDGIYIKFLNSSKTIGVNEHFQFWSASVINIAIACYFYKRVDEGKINAEEWVSIKAENIVLGSGIAHLLNPETKFKLEDLVVLMLTLSDNATANELIDLLGWEEIGNYISNDLKLENTTFKHKFLIKAGRGPNLTTASDMGNLLEMLYKKALPYSDKILEIMNEEKDRNRIPLYIPNDIKIPHKYGSLPEAVHDVGIVYAKNPFIFVFLSDNQLDKHRTTNVLSKCAKLCFDYAQN